MRTYHELYIIGEDMEMDALKQSSMRDANGRFVPGQSGNPQGKKPGTRNRATVLREALAEGEDIAAARIVIDKALAGDQVAARFIVDRLMPRPRGREIELDLPAGASAGDIVTAYDATVQAMAAGEITPDEALTVTRVLDGRLTALKAAGRERELSPPRRKEPSPSGRGQGEGVRRASDGAGAVSARRPHPDPLPLSRGPLVPAAAAGVAKPRREQGEGMADSSRGGFIGDHLHSACILQMPAGGDAVSAWSVPAAFRATPAPAGSWSAGIPG
jgi:hypothetical protein